MSCDGALEITGTLSPRTAINSATTTITTPSARCDSTSYTREGRGGVRGTRGFLAVHLDFGLLLFAFLSVCAFAPISSTQNALLPAVGAYGHSLPDAYADFAKAAATTAKEEDTNAKSDARARRQELSVGSGTPNGITSTTITAVTNSSIATTAALGSGCAVHAQSLADEWVCNFAAAEGFLAEGTVCTKACPAGTVGEPITTTCVAGQWSLHAELMCAHNSSCPTNQRLSVNGWSCNANTVNGSFPQGTACLLPCYGDVSISSVCHDGAWSQYPFPACSGDIACKADSHIFGWACNSTSVLELHAHSTVCMSPCPSGGGNITAACNNGNWTTTDACAVPSPAGSAANPAGAQLCPNAGAELCRALDVQTTECGQFYAYNSTMLTRDPTGTTTACTDIVLVDGTLSILGDDVWVGLSTLTSLDITGTFQANGSHRFAGLENLLSLTVSAMTFTTLPPSGFAEMKKLTWLDLGSNHLTLIPDDAFAGLTNLKLLNLAYNQLSTIENTPFKDLASLEMMNLEYNGMTVINKNMFTGLKNVTYLDLKYNQITVSRNSAGAFAELPLEILLLAKSGISCAWAKDPKGGAAPSSTSCSEA